MINKNKLKAFIKKIYYADDEKDVSHDLDQFYKKLIELMSKEHDLEALRLKTENIEKKSKLSRREILLAKQHYIVQVFLKFTSDSSLNEKERRVLHNLIYTLGLTEKDLLVQVEALIDRF